MKKILLPVVTLTMIIVATLFNSCTKDDATAPVVTIKGSATLTIDLGDTYTDAGATANDDTDGDITSSIVTSNTVNASQVGVYTVKYNVTDAAGNSAQEVTRTVTVRSDKLAGTYDVSSAVTSDIPGNSGNYTFTVTVTQSSAAYNRILIQNFAGLGSPVTVYVTIDGSTVTIPSQTPSGMSTSGTISGSGQYNGSQFKITSFSYSIVYSNGTDNCNDTYTKQ